jgi:luciferase-like monooxygenase
VNALLDQAWGDAGMTLPLSVLDLAPVSADSTGPQALRNSIELAQRADRLGYTRYWLAQHPNIPGIAISTPEIMISVIARETTHMRVGSGGVMLPTGVPELMADHGHFCARYVNDSAPLGATMRAEAIELQQVAFNLKAKALT